MRKASVEDYLRHLHDLYESLPNKKTGMRSVDIAESLKISKAGASQMLRKLAEGGYVKKGPYSAVFFTKKGFRKAKLLIRNYRVLGVFLHKKLDFEKNEMEHELHMLEHAFSAKAMKRLDDFLGNPCRCPHGKKIHR